MQITGTPALIDLQAEGGDFKSQDIIMRQTVLVRGA